MAIEVGFGRRRIRRVPQTRRIRHLTFQGFRDAFCHEDHGVVVMPETDTAQGRGVSGVARLNGRAKEM